jgi:hypothetical protein
MMSSMMRIEPTRRKAEARDEVECDWQGGRKDIKWLGGEWFLGTSSTRPHFSDVSHDGDHGAGRLHGANWHVLISNLSTEWSPRQLD